MRGGAASLIPSLRKAAGGLFLFIVVHSLEEDGVALDALPHLEKTLIPVENAKRRELLGREGKVEDVGIFGGMKGIFCARDGQIPLLDVPPQEDLRGRFLILFRKGRDNFFGEEPRAPAAERVPRFEQNSVLF